MKTASRSKETYHYFVRTKFCPHLREIQRQWLDICTKIYQRTYLSLQKRSSVLVMETFSLYLFGLIKNWRKTLKIAVLFLTREWWKINKISRVLWIFENCFYTHWNTVLKSFAVSRRVNKLCKNENNADNCSLNEAPQRSKFGI